MVTFSILSLPLGFVSALHFGVFELYDYWGNPIEEGKRRKEIRLNQITS